MGNAEARHQLFYFHLKQIATRVWKHNFGVTGEQCGNTGPDPEDVAANLCRSLPLFESNEYKQLLITDLPETAKTSVPSTCIGANLWTPIVHEAMEWFASMEGYWLISSPIVLCMLTQVVVVVVGTETTAASFTSTSVLE